eukprot:5771236-Pyramimonas_sp.AAC.1
MRKIYQTGLKAAAYYGAEVVGLTNPELHEAQPLYLKIVGPRCAADPGPWLYRYRGTRPGVPPWGRPVIGPT